MNLQRIIIGLLILVVFIQYCTLANAQIDLKDEYMDMVILLDRSGSMISTDPEGLSVAAASFIIDQLSLTNEKNMVAVVPFSSNAYILGQEKPNPQAALTHYPAALIEMMTAGISNAGEFTFRENSPDNPTAFYNLLRGQMQERGYTELGKALDLAKEILANGRPEVRKVILLISDGIPEPDISSEARLNELSHIVGNDLIRKIKQKRLQTDIQNLNKRFAEYLLNNIVSDLAREGISIYPVAFHRRGEESLALVEYLKQIKKATIGEEEIISVDADTLISELVGFIPSGANHIRLRNIKGFITGTPSSKTFNITILEIALQTRFFFSYKGTRKSHKPRVKIYIGNTPLADTESPERFDAVTFNSLRKRDGSIVYHSFRIENLVVSEANLSEKAKESLRIEVIDSSTGGVEGLPDTDLFIDIRSSLYPEIEVIPETLTATAPIEMRFKLFAEVKNEVKVIDITGADIFIIGKEPEDIKEISYKMRNVRYEGGIAISNLTDGVPKAGEYILKVKLYFQPSPDSQETAHIYFSYLIKVQSPLPLEGNVWIARKGSKIERESGLKIILPPIGEEFHISYDAIEVRASLNQVIDNLTPFLPPFRHVEKGVELESINRKWANVSPSVIRGLTASRYVPLKVSVEIPSEIPPDIPDGAYQSVLEIRDGVRVIDSVPVSIGVSIPRFVFNKEDINKPFDPNVEVSEKIAEKTILYPGDIPHSISVKLWSTSLSGVEAKGYFMDKRALKYTIEGEAEERTDHVLYDVAGVTFNIPGKNERTPGSVKSEVRLKDPSLNGMTFMNTIYITGKQHREIPVKLIVKVYFIPPIFLRSGFMLLFALGIYLISRWWGLRKFRDLFEGAETVKEIHEGEPSDHEIRFKRRVIGRFSYKGDTISSASVGSFSPFEAKNRVILFEAENASYRRDETRKDITQSYFPQEGDEIIVGRGKGRFTIRINKSPSADELSYSYSIEQSPLGSGKMMYFHFVSAMLFSLMSLLGFIYPYLILQLIRL